MESNSDVISMLSEASAIENLDEPESEVSSDNVKVILAENLRQRNSSVLSCLYNEQDDTMVDDDPKKEGNEKVGLSFNFILKFFSHGSPVNLSRFFSGGRDKIFTFVKANIKSTKFIYNI